MKRQRVDRSLIETVPVVIQNDTTSTTHKNIAKKKKVEKKVLAPQIVPSYWNEWKNVFLVGTEMNIYQDTFSVNWDFDHLYQALVNKDVLKGKHIYIFGSTEPQLINLNGSEVSVPLPHLVVVVGDIPAPALIGVTSVQRQNEEILPFEDMKLTWTPFKSKVKELGHLDNVYILESQARKTRVVKMSEDAQKKFDYCLPYIFLPDAKQDKEYPTDLTIQVTVGGRGLSLDFDYSVDDVKEFVAETKTENELNDGEAEIVEKAIVTEVAATKEKYKKQKEDLKKKIESFSTEERRALAGLKFYKFYPQNKDVDISHLKSAYINRYYGRAHKTF